ncbi:MAG: hypothetical protein IJE89_00585 [Bacilli bacterium]|nr:hypothetical protein [Bacilli bacterium]
MKKQKKVTIANVFLIVAIFLIIGGGTFAFWTWVNPEEEKTNIIFKTPGIEEMKSKLYANLEGSGNMEVTDLKPSLCNGDNAIKKTIVINYLNQTKQTATVSATLEVPSELFILPVKEITENNELTEQILIPTQENLQELKFALTTESTSCDDGIVTDIDGNEIKGNFSQLVFDTQTKKNEQLTLFTHNFTAPSNMSVEDTKIYYLWIWLDLDYTHTNIGNRNDDPMQGIRFITQWSGEIAQNNT